MSEEDAHHEVEQEEGAEIHHTSEARSFSPGENFNKYNIVNGFHRPRAISAESRPRRDAQRLQ